jgi:hypothetical protein
MRFGIGLKYPLVQYILLLSIINNHKLKIKIFALQRATARIRARTDYANRACNAGPPRGQKAPACEFVIWRPLAKEEIRGGVLHNRNFFKPRPKL